MQAEPDFIEVALRLIDDRDLAFLIPGLNGSILPLLL